MSTDDAGRFGDEVVDQLRSIQTQRRIGWVVKIVAVLAVAVFFALAYGVVGFSIGEMIQYWPEFRQALAGYFPTTTYFEVVPFLDVGRYWQFIVDEQLFQQSVVTVSMAFLGTIIGLPGALLLGTLGSERIMPFPFNFLFRGTMSVIRAVPALVWALIFIPLGGVTPFTGTLAIATDTMGYLGRLFTDELEEIGDGPIEGIESTGADKRQVVFFGMLSQVMRQYIAWTMYIFELNVRVAITLGLIGAGGLGYVMNIQRQTFQYTNMMAAILVSVVLLISIEMTSQRIRSHLRNDETESFLALLKGLPQRWAASVGK